MTATPKIEWNNFFEKKDYEFCIFHLLRIYNDWETQIRPDLSEADEPSYSCSIPIWAMTVWSAYSEKGRNPLTSMCTKSTQRCPVPTLRLLPQLPVTVTRALHSLL